MVVTIAPLNTASSVLSGVTSVATQVVSVITSVAGVITSQVGVGASVVTAAPSNAYQTVDGILVGAASRVVRGAHVTYLSLPFLLSLWIWA